MRFPNWVCNDCGRPFGRKWNGRRHIELCHHGSGGLVSFIDYLPGRQFGIYPSSSPPSYRRNSTSYFDICKAIPQVFSTPSLAVNDIN
jgi:hypothetical protein